MSDQGPVCHIPPVDQPANPKAHDIPGIGAPAIPTIASLVKTVNDLQRVVRALSGQVRPTITTGAGGGSNGFKTNEDKKKNSRWTESGRVTEKVRVYNPDDKEQFVDVEQINQLRMKDGVTGEQWTWDRDRK